MLLDELRANPDDDAVRLVYADQLASTDPRRAELIALQCAVERGGLPRDGAVAARRRIAELLEKDGARWAKLDGLATRWTFARGFVDRVAIDAQVFGTRGDELVARTPLLRWLQLLGSRSFDVFHAIGLVGRLRIPMLDLSSAGLPRYDWHTRGYSAELVVERLITTGALRVLRGLAIDHVTGSALRTLVESDEAAGLEELVLVMDSGHRHGLALSKVTPRPRSLRLRMPTMHRAWVEERDGWLDRVTDLGCVYSAQLPTAMRARLRRLELRTELSADALRAIADDAAYGNLEELSIEVAGAASAAARRAAFKLLLRAEHLRLRVLRLTMAVDQRLVTALLAAPLARTLEVLDLRVAPGAQDLALPKSDALVLRS